MRFFTSFHYAQNDSKIEYYRHLGWKVLRRSRKTFHPKYENTRKLVIPMRSEESFKVNRTLVII